MALAFVSHSFDNAPEFDNVVDALAQRSVEAWNPSRVKAGGSSLREQLRTAVNRCDVCVFVATRTAIDSSWCGAELGAFWGAGKPIVVYLAEPSLDENELPPIVRGDVYERRLSRIAERAKELIDTMERTNADVAGPEAAGHGEPSIADLTIDEFERVVTGAINLAMATSSKSDDSTQGSESVAVGARAAARTVLAGFRATEGRVQDADEQLRRILWVDDRPGNNTYERQGLESLGFTFSLALSTQEALEKIANDGPFSAIISDMGRPEGPREGYALLEKVRQRDTTTPFFIYAGSNAIQHQREAAARGAQGSTNQPLDLINMVIEHVPHAQPSRAATAQGTTD